MAISNRYGRTSDISVINDADWSVYTFRVKDYSEPGTSLIQAWEISTPIEVVTTLNDIKNIEAELKNMETVSKIDADISYVSPASGIFGIGAPVREYTVNILITSLHQ